MQTKLKDCSVCRPKRELRMWGQEQAQALASTRAGYVAYPYNDCVGGASIHISTAKKHLTRVGRAAVGYLYQGNDKDEDDQEWHAEMMRFFEGLESVPIANEQIPNGIEHGFYMTTPLSRDNESEKLFNISLDTRQGSSEEGFDVQK